MRKCRWDEDLSGTNKEARKLKEIYCYWLWFLWFLRLSQTRAESKSTQTVIWKLRTPAMMTSVCQHSYMHIYIQNVLSYVILLCVLMIHVLPEKAFISRRLWIIDPSIFQRVVWNSNSLMGWMSIAPLVMKSFGCLKKSEIFVELFCRTGRKSTHGVNVCLALSFRRTVLRHWWAAIRSISTWPIERLSISTDRRTKFSFYLATGRCPRCWSTCKPVRLVICAVLSTSGRSAEAPRTQEKVKCSHSVPNGELRCRKC